MVADKESPIDSTRITNQAPASPGPSVAELMSAAMEVTRPSAEVMAQMVRAVQPAAELMSAAMEVTRPSAEVMAQMVRAVQPAAELMSAAMEVTQPSADLMALVTASLESPEELMDEIAAATVPAARLLEELQHAPGLADLSEASARLAEQMILDGSHADLLALSELDEFLGDPSEPVAGTGQLEVEESGQLLGLSPERYVATTVATMFVLLWVYIYLSELIRTGQDFAIANRASLVLEWAGLAAVTKDVYAWSLRMTHVVQGKSVPGDGPPSADC